MYTKILTSDSERRKQCGKLLDGEAQLNRESREIQKQEERKVVGVG